MDELKQLNKLVTELNTTNSTTDKTEILAKYPECKEILSWTYDPFKQYYVSSDNILKMEKTIQPSGKHFADIFALLESLDSRKYTGHDAIGHILQFIQDNKIYRDLILRILDRNLKTRADAKLINKVWPGTVPSFEVALAEKYRDYKERVHFDQDTWFASRKLDGVRVITIISANGDIKFLSRRGKEFTTLDNVRKELQKKLEPYRNDFDFFKGGLVLDGEMCIVDKNGDENFTDMIKLIRRKDYTVEHPKYKIFDMMVLAIFEEKENLPRGIRNIRLTHRINLIKLFKEQGIFDGGILDPVEQRIIKAEKDLTDFMAEGRTKGWEGLIIRKDTPYKSGRSSDMLKVKDFMDEEFTVQDVEMGPIRNIVNGKEITETMLSAIKITYKGFPVSVGSGFSIQQRKDFYKDPSKILGKTVTVAYFEETTNDRGTLSLRFPTVKAIYDGDRDV
jgi:DNA ligase-1